MKRRLGSGRTSPPAGFEPATPLTARPLGRFISFTEELGIVNCRFANKIEILCFPILLASKGFRQN